jgi:hypothetical protein
LNVGCIENLHGHEETLSLVFTVVFARR